MPCPEADPGLAREVQLQREAAEWNPPTSAEEIPLAAEEDIPVIDVGRYLDAYNVRFGLLDGDNIHEVIRFSLNFFTQI